MKTVELILHFWIHADKDGDFSSNDIDIFEITGSNIHVLVLDRLFDEEWLDVNLDVFEDLPKNVPIFAKVLLVYEDAMPGMADYYISEIEIYNDEVH